jgi:hypothetical protein
LKRSRFIAIPGVAVVGLVVLVAPVSATAAARGAGTTATMATTTTVTASPSQFAHGQPSTLTAIVTPPTADSIDGGTVTFTDAKSDDLASCSGAVNTRDDGSAFAACTTSALSVGTYPVTATYSGSADFGSSHGQTTVTVSGTNPTITDRPTAAHAKTAYGWYRSNVTVSFTCEPGSGTLTTACPKPVVLSKNRAGQSLTRTVTNSAGGSATITVKAINIDKTAPTIAIHGLSRGRLKAGHKLTMTARDTLSGVIHRGLAQRRRGQVVHYTATAKDRAGNVTAVKGKYRR